MTDVSLDAFLPLVLPYVRDCPDIVARAATRSAVIEFCNESQWWVEPHTSLTLVSGLNHYEFDPPTDADVVAITEMRVGDYQMKPKSIDELNLIFPAGDWRTYAGGTPIYFTQETSAEFILVPVPAETIAQGIRFSVALRPAQDAEYINEEIYRRWAEEIAYGARSRLHETPGQIYYDENAALKYRAKFWNGIGRARAERNRGLTRGPVQVRFPAVI